MVQRARLILMLAEGQTYAAVEQALGCSSPYVTRWKRRFLERRMHGLDSRYVGGQPRLRTAALEAKILEKTRSQPQDGSTHWSTRKLGAELGVSHMMVARVWARAGLQPHRLERYMASDDLDFERKAADRKLMRYIRHYNKRTKPIRRTYRDISRRITHDSAVSGH